MVIPLCDPAAAYRTELYNQEILFGFRQGSMTFAPGSYHVSDCPVLYEAIVNQVRQELMERLRTTPRRSRNPRPLRAQMDAVVNAQRQRILASVGVPPQQVGLLIPAVQSALSSPRSRSPGMGHQIAHVAQGHQAVSCPGQIICADGRCVDSVTKCDLHY